MNKKILQMCHTIQQKENGNAVIILAGDHGYRANAIEKDLFSNYNAIYIPSSLQKEKIPDSITMVNEFRYVLNAVFNQRIPLLSDSLIYLQDVKP